MAEVHFTIRPIDGSGNQIVFHNPDNANGSQPLPPSDVPAPSKSGSQTTVKVVGTPGVAVRFSNPA